MEQFEIEAVNILLEWTVQEDIHGLMYNVSVFPRANLQYNSLKTAQLSLSYNTLYNVSIAALCGENSSPTLLIKLHYGMSYYIYLYFIRYKSCTPIIIFILVLHVT